MIVDAETRQQHRYKDKCGHCRVVCCFFGEIKKMNVKCGNGLTDNTDQTSDKKGFYTVCKNVSFRLAFLLECLIFLCIGGKIFLFFIRHFISLFLLFLFFHYIYKMFYYFIYMFFCFSLMIFSYVESVLLRVVYAFSISFVYVCRLFASLKRFKWSISTALSAVFGVLTALIAVISSCFFN